MVNSSVAAVLALAIYGCSTADTTTIEVEHSVSVPTRPTTETSDVESATTAVPAEVGSRLLPVGALDFSEIELNVACEGPPQLVRLASGTAEVSGLTVSLRGTPTFGDITGDGVDDALVTLTCSRGPARVGDAVTAILSDEGDGRATIALPLGVAVPDEYAFPSEPDGSGIVSVQMATLSAENAEAAFPSTSTRSQSESESESQTESTSQTESASQSDTGGSDGEAADDDGERTGTSTTTTLPEGAAPTRVIRFTVTAQGASLAEESTAGLSGQSSADLSAKGLGPWALGAERNTVVAELLKLDPAATQSADLPICLEPLRDQGSAESVTSGALTLGFADGQLRGIWIDLTFGAPPPIPITVGNEPLNGTEADVILAKFPGSTITTETDGTRLMSLSPVPAGLWIVADAEGYPVGAGLADQPCAVTG